jgi:hypothetical protein
MQRRSVVDGAGSRLSHAALSDVQAGFGVGHNVRKGERGTKVFFVKQLQVRATMATTTAPRPAHREANPRP